MATDPELTSTLREALKKRMYFAFVANGSKGALLAGKRKVSPEDANEAKVQLGGGTIYKGRCVGEEGTLVFEVAKKSPTTLADLIKKVIKKDTGLNYPVEVRVAGDLAEEGEEKESDAETETPAPTQAPPPPPVSPPSPPQEISGAVKRLNGMTAAIKTALEGPNKDRVQTQLAAANSHIKNKNAELAGKSLDELEALISRPGAAQGVPPPDAQRFATRLKAIAVVMQKADATGTESAKAARLQIGAANKLYVAKQFEEANAALDAAEVLLKQALAKAPDATRPDAKKPQAVTPPSQAPQDDAGLAEEWERRVIALEPRVLEAQKKRAGEAKWMTMFTSAQDLGEAGKYDQSLGVLKELEDLLNAPTKARVDRKKEVSIVALQTSRLKWDETRKKVRDELNKLEKTILEECKAINDDLDSEDEIDVDELTGKTKKLYEILEKLDERLIDKLDEALNSQTTEARQEKHAQALEIIKEYQASVNRDPLLALIDNSGFASTSIKQTFADVLNDLASKL